MVRLALVLGGVLCALVLAEGALRGAALLARATGDRSAMEWLGGGRRIVCLGDSNTFGLWVKPNESYPRVLHELLRHTGEEADVINLGAPGVNSSRMRSRFLQVLQSVHPTVVLLMVGANDVWTAPAPLTDTSTDWSYALWQGSRVFRLLYMLRRSLQPEQLTLTVVPPRGKSTGSAIAGTGADAIDFTWTGPTRTEEVAGWQSALYDNLLAMAAEAKRADVEMIFLTYPSDQLTYALANAIIRQSARASGTTLVDLGRAFTRRCPDGNCPALFFRDQHPTARGYALAATILQRHFTGAGDDAESAL